MAIFGPLYEVASRMSGLDPNVPNPGAGGRLGALVFAGDQGRQSFQNWYWKMLNPRFGFAYQLKEEKIVVRGGYGISNTPNISNGFAFPGKSGFNGSISLTATTGTDGDGDSLGIGFCSLLSGLLARMRHAGVLAGQPDDDIDHLVQVEPGGIDLDRVVGLRALRGVEPVAAVLIDLGGSR